MILSEARELDVTFSDRDRGLQVHDFRDGQDVALPGANGKARQPAGDIWADGAGDPGEKESAGAHHRAGTTPTWPRRPASVDIHPTTIGPSRPRCCPCSPVPVCLALYPPFPPRASLRCGLMGLSQSARGLLAAGTRASRPSALLPSRAFQPCTRVNGSRGSLIAIPGALVSCMHAAVMALDVPAQPTSQIQGRGSTAGAQLWEQTGQFLSRREQQHHHHGHSPLPPLVGSELHMARPSRV
ncbi:uncharacterized protein B0I36DRAFT_345387 [Microdochium trichocladiopsis]|uniref:Uncharacterized protein n=1 Tax=Microdochium trichocladiopsis TaxID=1682393 RepID=A0A9P8YFW3_9PEZI|nr:uncharacterized protein B0I36DRAFT_345387 [Microdochium trichocladiopsis]KAH7037239.1 hypothetical protein B0I36DRAFT_345387 [Microdochium trichocladiopsis]